MYTKTQGSVPTVVLCLDIDNMLINSSTSLNNTLFVDINGEDQIIHIPNYNIKNVPTGWYNFLVKLQKICAKRGIELNVQIISAKSSGDADATVDAVVSILHPFLKPIDKDGLLYDDTMPSQYLYQIHVQSFIDNKRKRNIFAPATSIGPDYDEDDFALPSIHIVKYNAGPGITSKVKVMKYIEDELRDAGKDTILMALADDKPEFALDIIDDHYMFFDAQVLSKTTASQQHNMRKYHTELLWQAIESRISQMIATYPQKY